MIMVSVRENATGRVGDGTPGGPQSRYYRTRSAAVGTVREALRRGSFVDIRHEVREHCFS
jgi:hypothetical protein